MADLKSLKKKVEPSKQKRNSKLQGVDLNKGSEIMSPFNDSGRSGKTKEVTKDLNFKIAPEFHSTFKKYAINRDMSMRDLLEQSFMFYAEAHKE